MKDGDDRGKRGTGRCQMEVKDGDDRCRRGAGRCQREVKDGDDRCRRGTGTGKDKSVWASWCENRKE